MFSFLTVFTILDLNAAIMKIQTPGCTSQSSLSEFANAVNSGDKAGMMRLILNQECFIVEKGTSYGLVNKQANMSLIRVYWDTNGYKLWVPTKAIQQ